MYLAADNYAQACRQLWASLSIIISRPAHNYRPLKCMGCQQEKYGISVDNERYGLIAER